MRILPGFEMWPNEAVGVIAEMLLIGLVLHPVPALKQTDGPGIDDVVFEFPFRVVWPAAKHGRVASDGSN